MNAEPVIYMIDELVAKPGIGSALLDAYLRRYAPGAELRGFRLIHRLVSPPMWLTEQSNKLVFVWALEGGAKAWWGARIAGGRDPEVERWWREVGPMLEGRSRRYFSEADAIEQLCHV